MIILVINEGHYIKDDKGIVWTQSAFDSIFWTRYLQVFDRVLVFARGETGTIPSTERFCISSCQNVEFELVPDYRGTLGLIKNWKITKQMLKRAAEKCDRIIFRAPSPLALIASSVAKSTGKPYAVEVMANPETQYTVDNRYSLTAIAAKSIMVNSLKRTCLEADGVSYVTNHTLQKLYPCRAMTSDSGNGYFTASYSSVVLHESDFQFKGWSASKKRVTILHIGSMFGKRKGQDKVMEVVAQLRTKGVDAKAIIAGDGRTKRDFEDHARRLGLQESIEFTGWISKSEEFASVYNASDIFLFPSESEGLPRCMIEAMAHGLLCLGSGADGIVELLGSQCISKSNSVSDYVASIEHYLENPEEAEKELDKQFDKAKEYKYSIIRKRSTAFYRNLRNCERSEEGRR